MSVVVRYRHARTEGFSTEEVMREINRYFDRPVYLADGPGVVREIRDAADAIEFLEEWPPELRDAASEVALRVCRRAHDSLVPISAARTAIEGFAKISGILEERGVTENAFAPLAITMA